MKTRETVTVLTRYSGRPAVGGGRGRQGRSRRYRDEAPLSLGHATTCPYIGRPESQAYSLKLTGNMEVYSAWDNMEAHVTWSVDLQACHISRAPTHNFLSRRHLTASRGDPSLDLMAGHLVLVCAVLRSSSRLLLLVGLFFFRS